MKKQKFITHSAEETRELGEQLAHTFKGGQVILLEGNLGAGKTHFVQGAARGLGVKKNITSPTFTIMNIYATPRARVNAKKTKTYSAQKLSHTTLSKPQPRTIARLAHLDLYRVKTLAEAYAIGVMDYIGEPSTLTLIEWPEKIKNALPKECARVHITIKHKNTASRSIMVRNSI